MNFAMLHFSGIKIYLIEYFYRILNTAWITLPKVQKKSSLYWVYILIRSVFCIQKSGFVKRKIVKLHLSRYCPLGVTTFPHLSSNFRKSSLKNVRFFQMNRTDDPQIVLHPQKKNLVVERSMVWRVRRLG